MKGNRSNDENDGGRCMKWMTWLDVGNIKDGRREYLDLLEKYKQDPDTKPETQDHPLAMDKDSKWSVFFENHKLLELIRLDLKRTYPDDEFYHSKLSQTAMLNILFVWSKIHHELSYRQGMNELLAPLWKICSENDETHAEQDCYVLFAGIMKRMKKYFIAGANSELDQIGNRIQEELLGQADPQLAKHFQKIGLEPQVYLLRYIRVLFSREFPLAQVLQIWDCLFEHSSPSRFDLLEYFVLTMLIYVREACLKSDLSGCLERLLKYPPIECLDVFIGKAVGLQSDIYSLRPMMTSNVVERSEPSIIVGSGVRNSMVKQTFTASSVKRSGRNSTNSRVGTPASIVGQFTETLGRLNIFSSDGSNSGRSVEICREVSRHLSVLHLQITSLEGPAKEKALETLEVIDRLNRQLQSIHSPQ